MVALPSLSTYLNIILLEVDLGFQSINLGLESV